MNPELEEEVKTNQKICPRWHVILLNDDEHTVEYVCDMLMKIFRKTLEESLQHAVEVHYTGATILLTTSKEHAELKQEQVHNFGADPLVEQCAGAMTCVIEPAEDE
jgi:ATP-dependent Clp protease adaptor protein ClpS